MNRLILLLSALVVGSVVTGCASTGLNSRTGAALVMVAQESGMATPDAGANKMGTACSQNILGIASVGDSTIDAAKKAGGITKVSSVDYDFTNILFIYGKVCTIVRGM